MDNTIFSILILGFLLGLKHAVESDHVAAVATIVSGERSVWRSSLVGALWGVGHTTSLTVVGIIVLWLRLGIPQSVGVAVEFVVGVMLVGLGVQALKRAGRTIRLHRHTHAHDGPVHAHFHLHIGSEATHEHRHVPIPTRSFWVGVVHGLAGSGALTVMVLAAAPSLLAGLGYVLIFGAGSIVGMLGMSGLIGLPFALTAGRLEVLSVRIQQVAGLGSIAVGVLVAWKTLQAALG